MEILACGFAGGVQGTEFTGLRKAFRQSTPKGSSLKWPATMIDLAAFRFSQR